LASVASTLDFWVAEVVRLQKAPNSHEFGYPKSSLEEPLLDPFHLLLWGGQAMKFLRRSKQLPEAPRPWRRTRPQLERLEDRALPSVIVGVSVDGMNTTNNDCNCQPPDPIAAAGPNHVVQMVNTAIEVFDKSGNVTSSPESLLNFFSNHKKANQSDPFVLYDEIKGQFIAGVLDYGSTGSSNYIDFATGTDSASGITWTLRSPIPSGEGKKFFDYPRVGYNADAYFIDGNMFRGGSFTNVQVITVDKTGKVLSRHDDSSLFTLTPAVMHGAASGGPEYFLESANSGGSALQMVTETKVTSSSPSFSTSSVSVPAYSGGGSPPAGVPSFDDRIFDVAYRDVSGVGHLVAAHQVAGTSGVAVVARWYDINAGTKVLSQHGDAPAGVSGGSTFMPTVDINTAGSIGMTFDESASTENWSMYVTLRTASDASGTMETAVKVANGASSSPDSRVGDFSSTTVDPSDGLTFWSANEYQGSDFWDTHIASYKSSVAGTTPVPLSATRTPTADGLAALAQATIQTARADLDNTFAGQPLPPVSQANFDVSWIRAALVSLDLAQANSVVFGSADHNQAASVDGWWTSLAKEGYYPNLDLALLVRPA
jgi:hypothetical protein